MIEVRTWGSTSGQAHHHAIYLMLNLQPYSSVRREISFGTRELSVTGLDCKRLGSGLEGGCLQYDGPTEQTDLQKGMGRKF